MGRQLNNDYPIIINDYYSKCSYHWTNNNECFYYYFVHVVGVTIQWKPEINFRIFLNLPMIPMQIRLQ